MKYKIWILKESNKPDLDLGGQKHVYYFNKAKMYLR